MHWRFIWLTQIESTQGAYTSLIKKKTEFSGRCARMFLCVFVCPYQNRNIFEYQNNQCKQCERRKEYVKYPYISCGCTHEIHTTEASSCSYQPKANCVKLDDDWNRVETRWKNGHDNDRPKNVNTYTDAEMYQSAR